MTDQSEYAEAAVRFEAVKIALSQDKTGYVMKMSIHPNEVPDSLLRSWVGARYAVAMVELDEEDKPVPPNAARAAKSAIQQAGILCKEPRFQAWLAAETGDLIMDEAMCIHSLCTLLGISSRKEFKENHEARNAFLNIRDQYREAHP